MARRSKPKPKRAEADPNAEETLRLDTSRWGGFRDGVGEREDGVDQQGFSIQLLRLRKEFNPFELPLSDRILRMIDFDRLGATRALRVDHDESSPRLVLVSERAPGFRLSELLYQGAERGIIADLGAALFVMRRLLATAAALHRQTGVVHFAIAPERIVITPRGDAVIVEAALAGAIEAFDKLPPAVRTALRLARATADVERNGPRLDVARIALVGMALVLGRTLDPTEDIDPLSPIVTEVADVAAMRAGDQFSAQLTPWFDRAITIDPALSFADFSEAFAALDSITAPAEARCAASRTPVRRFLHDLVEDSVRLPMEALEEDRIREIRARHVRHVPPAGAAHEPPAADDFTAPEDTIAALMGMPVVVEEPAIEIMKQAAVLEETATVESPIAIAEPVIVEEPVAVENPVPVEEASPVEEAVPVEEAAVPLEEAVTDVEPAIADEPAGWDAPPEEPGAGEIAPEEAAEILEEPTAVEEPITIDMEWLVAVPEPAAGSPAEPPFEEAVVDGIDGELQATEPAIEEPPVEEPPVEEPPVEEPPIEEPTIEEPPAEEPPVEEPPVGEPPVEESPIEEPPVEAPAYAAASAFWRDEPVEEGPADGAPPVEEPPVEERPEEEPPIEEPSIEELPPHEPRIEEPSVEQPAAVEAAAPADDEMQSWIRAAVEQVARAREERPLASAPLPPMPEPRAPVFELPDVPPEKELEPETTTLSDIARDLGLTIDLPLETPPEAARSTGAREERAEIVPAPPVEERPTWETGIHEPLRDNDDPPPPPLEWIAPPSPPAPPAVDVAPAAHLPAPTIAAPERSRASRRPWVGDAAGRFVRIAAPLVVLAAIAGAAIYGGRRYYTSITAPGTLVVESTPNGAEVLIDGAERGVTPLSLDLPPGTHAVELRRRGLTRRFTVEVRPGEQATQTLDWSTVRAIGSLAVTSNPSGAQVLVDGRLHGVTPITIPDLPAGRRNVVIQSSAGTIRRTVTIAADETATLDESIFSGWIAVFAPVELEIYEAGRIIGTTENSRIMVAPGRHELELVNKELGFRETRSVDVEPGQTVAVNITEVPAKPQ